MPNSWRRLPWSSPARSPAGDRAGRLPGLRPADFVEELRSLNMRPQVTQTTSGRRSAIVGAMFGVAKQLGH